MEGTTLGGGRSLKQCQEPGGRSAGSCYYPASPRLQVAHLAVRPIFLSRDSNVSCEYGPAIRCILQNPLKLLIQRLTGVAPI